MQQHLYLTAATPQDPYVRSAVQRAARMCLGTFDALALEFYNDEKQAWLIIQANLDYCDVLIFEADIEIKIPIVEFVSLPETLPPWRRETS